MQASELSIKSEKGWILLQVVAGAGVLLILFSSMISRTTFGKREERSSQGELQLRALVSGVQALVNRPQNCGAIWQDAGGNPMVLDPALAPITIPKLVVPGGSALITAGSISGALSFPADAVVLANPIVQGGDVALWTLKIKASRMEGTGDSAVGGSHLQRNIKISIKTTGTPLWTASSCMTLPELAQLCALMGGTFDVATTPVCTPPACACTPVPTMCNCGDITSLVVGAPYSCPNKPGMIFVRADFTVTGQAYNDAACTSFFGNYRHGVSGPIAGVVPNINFLGGVPYDITVGAPCMINGSGKFVIVAGTPSWAEGHCLWTAPSTLACTSAGCTP